MYIPQQNRMDDWNEIRRFVSSARAGDLVTVKPDGLPIATLMPLVWEVNQLGDGNYGNLVMHMARGNEQWRHIEPDTQGLVIVHGAQAYISPSNYANKFTDHKVVPTWNYQSVHFSGTVEASQDEELLRKIVTDLTAVHESERAKPWLASESDPHYFDLQLKGIVAIIFTITKVEAKSKLSQNRSLDDRNRVIADLLRSEIPGEDVVAQEMIRLQQ